MPGGESAQAEQSIDGRKEDLRMVPIEAKIDLGKDILPLQKGNPDGFRRALQGKDQHRYPVN